MHTTRMLLALGVGLILAIGTPASAPADTGYDVYKYSQPEDIANPVPVPDVDKPDRDGDLISPDDDDMSCWQACAANLLGAAGYGIGAPFVNPTPQQRADHIYGQLNTDLGYKNMGRCENAINYWLYTYGKNPADLNEYMPGNPYTDVTVEYKPEGLTLQGAASDYNFLLDELDRCQYVCVAFDYPEHCMALVGGNYYPDDGGVNQSIWHDSDRDNADSVVTMDDDVYTNAPMGGGSNAWILSDYVTAQANKYVTLCEGLNKPEYAVTNYDAAYYLQDTDQDGTWDPEFRVAGEKGSTYGEPDWNSDTEVVIPNEFVDDMWKEVFLLVDYKDRVAGRQEDVTLLVCGEAESRDPTSVKPSPDDGQLLFYWDLSDLDYQPQCESLVFPDAAYSTLDDYVKDWNVATNCVPEPATLGLLVLGVGALLSRRRR